MQFLKRRAPERGPDDRGADLRWGITGLCLSALLVAGVGVVYVRGTESTRTYRADIARATTSGWPGSRWGRCAS